jgi:hypothetical protein
MVFKDGMIQLHQEPGLGFGYDEAFLSKLAKWE